MARRISKGKAFFQIKFDYTPIIDLSPSNSRAEVHKISNFCVEVFDMCKLWNSVGHGILDVP